MVSKDPEDYYGPDRAPLALGGVFGAITDLYWRRTRPPSDDAPWGPIARLFYRREPSG